MNIPRVLRACRLILHRPCFISKYYALPHLRRRMTSQRWSRRSPRRFPAWGLAVVMKWLPLGNARNMLMTVNIKLSIIVIAEIIPSTDDTCQSISPQNGPSKVNCTWSDWRDSKQYARKSPMWIQCFNTTGCLNYYCNRMPNTKA